MDLTTRIKKVKNETLKKIEEAAKTGNTSSVVMNSRLVEEIDNLEMNLDQLIASLEKIENRIKNGENFALIRIKDENISPKKRGENRRMIFLKQVEKFGFNIYQVKGVRYKFHNRYLIGIAYASEKRPNRWFLGLPPEDFDNIVLLCERKDGKMLNFIFSQVFYNDVKSHLSVDDNGQIKFNIAKKDSEYQLIIPKIGNQNITKFLDDFNNLKDLLWDN